MTNYLIFGGLKSLDHFVWISGEGTFKAPKRSVEYISVPGRNGDLIVDNGKWENITVTYPAFIPYGFEQHMSEFRMELCKKLGYQRLEDTYHPDEFRLASFTDGLEPSMTQWNEGGVFNLSFNCKPQRFLKSGEEPLRFLPYHISGTTVETGYMQIAGNRRAKVTAKAPASDTLTVTVQTFNASGTAIRSTNYTVTNGGEFEHRFTAGEAYFKLAIAGYSDIDSVQLEVEADIQIDGQTQAVTITAGRTITIENPTGYAAKPLIECFSKASPYITLTNYENGEELEYYEFHVNDTGVSHFYIDCDLQYVYDDAKQNLTNYLYLTTAQSAYGEGLVFPELSGDTTELYVYKMTNNFADGTGLLNIYPRWWKL